MVCIKAFKGIRPVPQYVKDIASPPYDVINKAEAREMAKGNRYSFLHVVKPEIDLPDTVNEYAPEVYEAGKKYLQKMMQDTIMLQDKEECMYIYAQTMQGRTQYGIVACAAVDDYYDDKIKKHELTRPDKEEDRKNHIRVSNMHYEPVFFAYRATNELDSLVQEVVAGTPEYDFIAADGIGHHFWKISDSKIISRIIAIFATINHTYVADGHHRTAAAAAVGKERREANFAHTGEEEYNYFLAVHFPDNQLRIMDYNRVVKDLNGLSAEEFIARLSERFIVEKKGKEIYTPQQLHWLSMYLNGEWYALQAKAGTYDDNDPIACLDVTILSEQILSPLLNITDLRNSKRIDFVGGLRGLGELKKRVDSGEMAAAFALYPVSMKQLFDIADSGNIMPPKTTWFEPKLRSGIILHSIE